MSTKTDILAAVDRIETITKEFEYNLEGYITKAFRKSLEKMSRGFHDGEYWIRLLTTKDLCDLQESMINHRDLKFDQIVKLVELDLLDKEEARKIFKIFPYDTESGEKDE